MKRKIIILLSLIFVMNIFAENNYLYVSFYKPYGKAPTGTEEYLFYDDGLIKQITHYDLREEGGTIHFHIDKSTSKLYRIVFTSEM